MFVLKDGADYTENFSFIFSKAQFTQYINEITDIFIP